MEEISLQELTTENGGRPWLFRRLRTRSRWNTRCSKRIEEVLVSFRMLQNHEERRFSCTLRESPRCFDISLALLRHCRLRQKGTS